MDQTQNETCTPTCTTTETCATETCARETATCGTTPMSNSNFIAVIVMTWAAILNF